MTDDVAQFPDRSKPQAPSHVFGEPREVAADPAAGRLHNQTERACVCGVVKITVHGVPAEAARKWRKPGQSDQPGSAPVCTAEPQP